MNDVIVVSLVLFLSVFLAASILPKSVLRCKLLSLGLVQPRVVPISSCSIPVFLKCMIFGLLLPLRLHPALVVGHLGRAVRHLPNAQHLEHQDSKRPHIAPEHTELDLFLHTSLLGCVQKVCFFQSVWFSKNLTGWWIPAWKGPLERSTWLATSRWQHSSCLVVGPTQNLPPKNTWSHGCY